MAVLHFFSSKFPSNIYSILFVYSTFQYVHYEIHAEVGKYDTVHNSYIKYVWLSLTIHVSILFYVNFKYVVLSIQISMRIFMAILSMFFSVNVNIMYVILFIFSFTITLRQNQLKELRAWCVDLQDRERTCA